MAIQDRSGTKYEQLLAASLEASGYVKDAEEGTNYLHPTKRQKEIAIPDTFIQPDLVIRNASTVKAVCYSTHWSKSRNCAFKYWRTWEEQAQQKVVLDNNFLSINCIFEALPEGSEPTIYRSPNELPLDPSRNNEKPIAFRGWYPGITYALLDSFDVTIAFPVGYRPVIEVETYGIDDHDLATTQLLQQALNMQPHPWLDSQWQELSNIRNAARKKANFNSLTTTESRYRIGLLHVYLFYRLLGKVALQHGINIDLTTFVTAIIEADTEKLDVAKLAKQAPFDQLGNDTLLQVFELLAETYVRTGKTPVMFCELESISFGSKSLNRVSFNKDLKLCLTDLARHINQPGFAEAMENAFLRYDELNGIEDALNDLSNYETVERKEAFVRETFKDLLNNPEQMAAELQRLADPEEPRRFAIVPDTQHWVLEMLIYLTGLNTAEDIYTRITGEFEKSGHSLWNHAPYADHAKLLPFLLQGENPCSTWSSRSKKRTLTADEFLTLSWQAIAACITAAYNERHSAPKDNMEIIQRYLETKSRRIISSELSGFEVLITHYLGDLSLFTFTATDKAEKERLKARLLKSWQTEITGKLWDSASLGMWAEGVSHNGGWIIKTQSAQDGHQSDKAKELAGRCRAVRLTWQHGPDPTDRTQWHFTQRQLPKLALVLDGDWENKHKQNLYEAGWDWVGDVSQLAELRELIQQDD